MSDTPRRNQMTQWTPAEHAIYHAALAVEAMPADPRLTEAVVLLGAARDSVADYVDGIESRRVTADSVELRLAHARKQANADGFQHGWHAVLARLHEGDSVDDLSALVPNTILASLERELNEARQIYLAQNAHLKRISGELTSARAEVERLKAELESRKGEALIHGADLVSRTIEQREERAFRAGFIAAQDFCISNYSHGTPDAAWSRYQQERREP